MGFALRGRVVTVVVPVKALTDGNRPKLGPGLCSYGEVMHVHTSLFIASEQSIIDGL